VSDANVEIVRSNLAAFKRGDFDAVEASYDPHILVRTDARWPESYIFGREAVARWFQGVIETGGSDVHQEEILDLGDRVLVRERWNISGQLSGVPGELQVSAIVTFREGLIILIEYFLDHEQALKAVGLER
jgi:ketosteroid isomerase-like protein